MADPQVAWFDEDGWCYDRDGAPPPVEDRDEYVPAIVMTAEYRAELRALVAYWHSTGRAGGYDLAAAIERMLEATNGGPEQPYLPGRRDDNPEEPMADNRPPPRIWRNADGKVTPLRPLRLDDGVQWHEYVHVPEGHTVVTAAELRALADRLDEAQPNDTQYLVKWARARHEAATIIRTVADLQAPARYALRREKGPLRESQLAAIVERIVEVGRMKYRKKPVVATDG